MLGPKNQQTSRLQFHEASNLDSVNWEAVSGPQLEIYTHRRRLNARIVIAGMAAKEGILEFRSEINT